jgi:hypothetical protein
MLPPSSAEDVAEDAALLPLATVRRLEHPLGRAREREGLQGDAARAGDADEEEPFAAEEAAPEVLLSPSSVTSRIEPGYGPQRPTAPEPCAS